MIVLIINGAPRVGKDTFIKLLEELTNKYVVAYSSIDWVKQIAKKEFNWDGVKDTKSRQLLSDLKNIATAWNDTPFNTVCARIKLSLIARLDYFCTNIREPAEIQKLVDWCKEEGISCYTVWIRQQKAEQEAIKQFRNNGDTQYAEYNYDWVINNDTSIEDFKQEIAYRLNKIGELPDVTCV